jgi:hypothetical protein
MTRFPTLSSAELLRLLEPPAGPVHMVLDTDTYNEIDDQFAVVYSLLSPNLTVEAFYAAPFHNRRSSGPADGMERSYEGDTASADKKAGRQRASVSRLHSLLARQGRARGIAPPRAIW